MSLRGPQSDSGPWKRRSLEDSSNNQRTMCKSFLNAQAQEIFPVSEQMDYSIIK